MQKRWVPVPKISRTKWEVLQQELGIHPVLCELLCSRGIYEFKSAKKYFRPSLDDLHDPFLMKDMDKAVLRIEEAIGKNEKMLIYGDYDVDGTTAVSLVYGFFRQFHSRMEYYLPDRYAEGYGISYKGVEYAAQNGFSLIIALDCGIKAMEQIDYARSLGIDVIIGDHHMPGEQLPSALAILDPKRADCAYPYKELSGCGIGFKLIQGFVLKNEMEIGLCYQYLDLVAVSIASDIVPITGENRVLTHFGLEKLNRNPSCGLQALIELSSNRNAVFTVSDIVFQIGPRINAAGRIEHAKDAVKLLLSKSLQEAQNFSEDIDIQNTLRKDVDFKITEEALNLIGENEAFQNKNTTVLYQSHWHKGVIGIVASRLTEKYYRPTIVMTEANGVVAGSARSVLGFDLYEALLACSDLLEQFGGHKYAAGLTMKANNVPAFQQRFEEVVTQRLFPGMLEQEISIEAHLNLSEIDAKFYRVLKKFEPFGPMNESPIFMSQRVALCGKAQTVGGNHLKMTVMQANSPSFACIGFGLGEYVDELNEGKSFDLCYTIEENNWREKRNLQLNLKGVILHQ